MQMVVATPHPLAPPPSHSPGSSALESLNLSLTSSQLRMPLPTPSPLPFPRSLPLGTLHHSKKCSVASPNLFAVVFALCSNGLSYDDVDELWLVLDTAP